MSPSRRESVSVVVPGAPRAHRERDVHADGATEPIVVTADEAFTLPDGRTIAIDGFVSDFRIGHNGVESASDEMRNPAVSVALREGDTIVEKQWLFINHPGFRHGDSRLGDLRAVSVEPLYETGLDLTRAVAAALLERKVAA